MESASHGLSADTNATEIRTCYKRDLYPEFAEYARGLSNYGAIFWCCAAFMVIIICVIYVINLRGLKRSAFKNTAFVVGVYPAVAVFAFVATLLPRARLLCEAIAQEAVMVAVYKFYMQTVDECGGIDDIMRKSSDVHLETRVLPCCCWPFCPLPRPELKEKHFDFLRAVVFQMPVVQCLIYVISLLLFTEDPSIYNRSYVSIQFFVAASILFGMWGVIMTVRTVESAGYRVRAKFLAVQVVLLIVKLQCGFAKTLPEVVDLPCVLSLNPKVMAMLVHNYAVIAEMLLLSLWAWRLYNTNDVNTTETMSIQKVSVDKIGNIDDGKMGPDVIRNKA